MQLVFPPEWRQPRNPLAEPAAAWARTFLTEFGFLNRPEAEERLESLDVAGFGWPFYAAERPVLCTVTAFLACVDAYADRRAERGEEDEAALIVAVRGEGTRPADPYHAAFWELGQRYYKRLGRNFLARHGERFRAWLPRLRRRPRLAGAAAETLDGYLVRRRVQIGILPILDFLELDLAEELPAVRLERSADEHASNGSPAEVVALQHDLRAFAAGSSRPNAVRLLQASEGLPAAEAGQRILERHNELAAELDRVGRALVRDQRLPPLTAWWIRLGGLLAGFGRFFADGRRAIAGAAREPAAAGLAVELAADDELRRAGAHHRGVEAAPAAVDRLDGRALGETIELSGKRRWLGKPGKEGGGDDRIRTDE